MHFKKVSALKYSLINFDYHGDISEQTCRNLNSRDSFSHNETCLYSRRGVAANKSKQWRFSTVLQLPALRRNFRSTGKKWPKAKNLGTRNFNFTQALSYKLL
jgi:hypothetical protein